MFIFSNFLSAVAVILSNLITILSWIIIIRALISWVNPDPFNPIVQFLQNVTEPILAPIRRLIPTWQIGIDFSPLIAILVLWFLNLFLVKTLADLALRLR
ncbi:MAG: YggT family protein [Candidatus Omnitrophica bacterium]|nr:YggT family protein [Candidatus Omnitrophota bacterium]